MLPRRPFPPEPREHVGPNASRTAGQRRRRGGTGAVPATVGEFRGGTERAGSLPAEPSPRGECGVLPGGGGGVSGEWRLAERVGGVVQPECGVERGFGGGWGCS